MLSSEAAQVNGPVIIVGGGLGALLLAVAAGHRQRGGEDQGDGNALQVHGVAPCAVAGALAIAASTDAVVIGW